MRLRKIQTQQSLAVVEIQAVQAGPIAQSPERRALRGHQHNRERGMLGHNYRTEIPSHPVPGHARHMQRTVQCDRLTTR